MPRTPELLYQPPERLDLAKVAHSFEEVRNNWNSIDDELDRKGIGRKDWPFDERISGNMLSAFSYLDTLLKDRVEPFSPNSLSHMLVLNNRVHYGEDRELMNEYNRALQATADKFYSRIGPIRDWYVKHKVRRDSPLKIAAEVYVSILGQPQLFVEGNHRTGSLIANWINMHHGYPPFVLNTENAIAYFAPSAEIKKFDQRSPWRGMMLPKYRKSFLKFWESNIDSQYMIKK